MKNPPGMLTQAEALQLLRRLREELGKRNLPIREMFLYGSIAKGRQHTWSDIDVAIICDRFLPSRHEEDMEIRRARRSIDVRISPFCLHKEDFENKYWSLPKEVQRHGIPVK